MAGDVLCQVTFSGVTFCGVTFCGVTFCGVTFCRGEVLCQVTFCGVTFCRGTVKSLIIFLYYFCNTVLIPVCEVYERINARLCSVIARLVLF